MSFLVELRAGRFRWDLVDPFPVQSTEDSKRGTAALTDLRALLTARVDADAVEASGELPAGLVADLHAHRLLALTVSNMDGGLDLSPLNAFRVLEEAARYCVPVGLVLSWHNMLGMGAYLPALPPGRLRDLLTERLAQGAVFGVADTEPGRAAADPRRQTVAVPTADGGGYLLTGEKCFIGNGSIADLLAVSATVRDDGRERIDLFLVDTHRDGFSVTTEHGFMGLRGSPNAALRLDEVYVPADHVLVAIDGGWRASPVVARINARARMNITVAPSLAMAKACLDWSREFLARRYVDGRPLTDYDAVQRRLATSLADVFAVDSVVEWCLLGEHGEAEYMAAKNIGTVTCWRVIDRTMSLFGAEGFESAASKARRGMRALPVERALRDIRGMLIAGGVDFNIDMRAGWRGILSPYYSGQVGAAPDPPAELSPTAPAAARFLRDQVADFAARCRKLTHTHPADDLRQRQEVHITLSRLADELFTMSLVVARAAALDTAHAQHLAGVYLAGARGRIASLWRALDRVDEVDHARVCRAWLAGDLEPMVPIRW